jgi:hypothetical protein
MPKLIASDRLALPTDRGAVLKSFDIVGTWAWDARTDLTIADTHAALLFNVDPDEAEAGLPLEAFAMGIHPSDRPRVLAAFRKGARDGRPYVREYRVHAADGTLRWVLTRGRFFCDHRGHPARGRGIVVDITALRATESEAAALETGTARADESPLDQAAAAAIAAWQAINTMDDAELSARAKGLLYEIGLRLAAEELARRRDHLS